MYRYTVIFKDDRIYVNADSHSFDEMNDKMIFHIKGNIIAELYISNITRLRTGNISSYHVPSGFMGWFRDKL